MVGEVNFERIREIRSSRGCGLQDARQIEKKERLNSALDRFYETKGVEVLADILHELIND